jgi:hypothetical protein
MSPQVRLSTAHLWYYHKTSTAPGRHRNQSESCRLAVDLHPKSGEGVIRGVHAVEESQNYCTSSLAQRREVLMVVMGSLG